MPSSDGRFLPQANRFFSQSFRFCTKLPGMSQTDAFERLSVDQLSSEKVIELHDYWRSARGDRRFPRRADIDPADIVRLLPNLMLTEIERDPLRVWYRVVGTGVVARTGLDFTRRYLDDTPFADDNSAWRRLYEEMLETGEPIFGRDFVIMPDGAPLHSEFCMLPLARDGVTIDLCLAMEDYAAGDSFGTPRRIYPKLF